MPHGLLWQCTQFPGARQGALCTTVHAEVYQHCIVFRPFSLVQALINDIASRLGLGVMKPHTSPHEVCDSKNTVFAFSLAVAQC